MQIHSDGKIRVLYLCHGHPRVRPGGAEQHAYELYQGMRNHPAFEPVLLARTGESAHRPHPGTLFSSIEDDPNQILMFTDPARYDHFLQTHRDKSVYTVHLNELLEAYRPDVVHFQHTSYLGVDAIRQVRNTLPDAPILYTLHEFIPICHSEGQMVRTRTGELCTEASPSRCHVCFPEIEPRWFFLRERFIKAHFELVDRFIAPSRLLSERYVEWGVPSEKIVYLDYGRTRRDPVPARDPKPGEPRGRFGFFGQLNPYKGILELLEAMRIIAERGLEDIHLYVNGANLDFQTPEFREQVERSLGRVDNVTLLGPYDQASLRDRMELVDWVVVPSVWWENSPLVIQEAFQHGRPVICSDIGGMAEKVQDGVDGLHFRVRNPQNLAAVIEHAVKTGGLWDRLRANIPEVYSSEDAVAAHGAIYRDLLGAEPAKRREGAFEDGSDGERHPDG